MRVISPSFEIMDRSKMTTTQKVEQFGRIAWKSEGKTGPGTDIEFCNKMQAVHHRSVIEGACLHLLILGNIWTHTSDHSEIDENRVQTFMRMANTQYLHIKTLGFGMVVSGTIRAFQEALGGDDISLAIGVHLNKTEPVFFNEAPDLDGEEIDDLTVTTVPFTSLADLLGDDYEDHAMVMVKFIVNRAVSHEIVRHRPCSFLQESQRYCNYSLEKFDREVTFVLPSAFCPEGSELYNHWYAAMIEAEEFYFDMIDAGAAPQFARTVLPNSCKTEIFVYATVTQWNHILALRTSAAADPSIREVMEPLSKELFESEGLWE